MNCMSSLLIGNGNPLNINNYQNIGQLILCKKYKKSFKIWVHSKSLWFHKNSNWVNKRKLISFISSLQLNYLTWKWGNYRRNHLRKSSSRKLRSSKVMQKHLIFLLSLHKNHLLYKICLLFIVWCNLIILQNSNNTLNKCQHLVQKSIKWINK